MWSPLEKIIFLNWNYQTNINIMTCDKINPFQSEKCYEVISLMKAGAPCLSLTWPVVPSCILIWILVCLVKTHTHLLHQCYAVTGVRVFKSFIIVSAGREVENFQDSNTSNNHRAICGTVYMVANRFWQVSHRFEFALSVWT